MRLASTRTTQLALQQSAPSTVICLRSACCLKLLHANALFRCSHPRGPSIPAPASHAAPAKAAEPAILTPAVPAPQRGRKSADCARKAAPSIACSTTPLLRVSCVGAAAVAAPPHVCSDCACLPVVPDKPRICTLVDVVVGPLTSECDRVRYMDAAAFSSPKSLPVTVSEVTSTQARRLQASNPVSNQLQQLSPACRRPAAESAHNKTLQFKEVLV